MEQETTETKYYDVELKSQTKKGLLKNKKKMMFEHWSNLRKWYEPRTFQQLMFYIK